MSSSGLRRRGRTPSRKTVKETEWDKIYKMFKRLKKEVKDLEEELNIIVETVQKKKSLMIKKYNIISFLELLGMNYNDLITNQSVDLVKLDKAKKNYKSAVNYILKLINDLQKERLNQQEKQNLNRLKGIANAILRDVFGQRGGNRRQVSQNPPTLNNNQELPVQNPPIVNNNELPTQNFFKKQFLTFWRVSMSNSMIGKRTTDIRRVTNTIILRRAIVLKDMTVIRGRETVSFKLGNVVYEEISSRRPQDTVRVFVRKQDEINSDDMKNFFEAVKTGTIVSAYIDRTALTPVPEPSNAIFGDVCKNYKGEAVVGFIPRNWTFVITYNFVWVSSSIVSLWYTNAVPYFLGSYFIDFSNEKRRALIRSINPVCKKMETSYFDAILQGLAASDFFGAPMLKAFGYDGSCTRYQINLKTPKTLKSVFEIYLAKAIRYLAQPFALFWGYREMEVWDIFEIRKIRLLQLPLNYWDKYKAELEAAENEAEVQTILSRKYWYALRTMMTVGGVELIKIFMGYLGQAGIAFLNLLSNVSSMTGNNMMVAINAFVRKYSISELILLLDLFFLVSLIKFLQSLVCPFLLYVTGQLENCKYQPVKKEKSELYEDLKF